jgi:EAL domain-containing protein (putative c-di-GMP-specific phosphodiesterase class I)
MASSGSSPRPSSFPIAEETGLIGAIGRWVLEQACAEACNWPGNESISVNLSGCQLADPEIVSDVVDVLDATDLDPERLTLEITETVLVDDVEVTIERLFALKALGARIAIDDFGTGYSSLAALSRFPADILKIDRSFVTDICSDHRHRDLATTIVRLGQALGMTTLAEGIENEAQRAELLGLGCQVGQGYLFSRPVAPADLRALMAAASAASSPSPGAPAQVA